MGGAALALGSLGAFGAAGAQAYGVGFAKLFEGAPGEMADVRLAVEGALPEWLSGTLVRNGPGRFDFGKRRATVAFDGFAKLHRFRIAQGEVTYSSRFLRSDSFNRTAERTDGDLAPMKTFGPLDPCLSLFGKAQGLFEMNDNMLVNVIRMGDSYLALSDAVGGLQFDLDSLLTLGAPPGIPQGGGFPSLEGGGNADGDSGSGGPFAPPRRPTAGDTPSLGSLTSVRILGCAHPLPDLSRAGHSLQILFRLGIFTLQSSVELYRISPDLKRTPLWNKANIKGRLPYMHSFSATEHYAVLFFYPLVWVRERFLELKPPNEALEWEGESKPTVIYVVDLETGETVTELETDPIFSFHHIDAYEEKEGQEVVVRLVGYPEGHVVREFWDMPLEILKNADTRDVARPGCVPAPYEYRIDLARQTVSNNQLTDLTAINGQGISAARQELPRVNDAWVGKRHCFTYGIVLNSIVDREELWAAEALSKFDLCGRGGSRVWRRENHYPSEPVFIPAPGAQVEDDGVLLSAVLDGESGGSYLLVLNATTMETLATAAVNGEHIPFGFHGGFF